MSSSNSQSTVFARRPDGLARDSSLPSPEDIIGLPSHAATSILLIFQRLSMMESFQMLAMLDNVRAATIQHIYAITFTYYYSLDVLESALQSINLIAEQLANSDEGCPVVSLLTREASEHVQGVNTWFLAMLDRGSELSAQITPIPEPFPIVRMLATLNGTAVVLFTLALGVLAGVFEVLSAISSEEGYIRSSMVLACLAGSITLAAALFGVVSSSRASVQASAHQATLRRLIVNDTVALSISGKAFAKWWLTLLADLERLRDVTAAAGGLLGEAERLVLLSHYRDVQDKMRSYEQAEPSFRKVLVSQSRN